MQGYRTVGIDKAVEGLGLPADRHLAIRADVTDEARVIAAFDEALAFLGRLDVLVTSAGVADTIRRPADPVDLGSTPVAVVLFDAGAPRPGAHAPAAADPNEGAATGTGRVQLSSKPEGAEVYFEKRMLGTTPILLRDLPTDRDIKLELKLPGFKATRKRIHWRGKDFIEATVRMRGKESDGGDADSEAEAPEPANN